MKTKRHILEGVAMLLALCFAFALVLRNGGTASGYPAGPTPTPSNPQGLVPRAYLPVVMNNYRTPPPATTSIYVTKTDAQSLNTSGCNLASKGQSGIIILDFGDAYPYSGNIARLPSVLIPVTSGQVESLTEAFLSGYWRCSQAGQYITVSVGTDNCSLGTPDGTHCPLGGNNLTYAHGQAWAQIVNDVSNWICCIGTSYMSREGVAGGIDAELQWNTPAVTENWVNGYSSVSGVPGYYDFGNCNSCPNNVYSGGLGWVPNNGWTNGDIWYVAWGAIKAFAVPEIYLTNTANADQWYRVALFAVGCNGACSSLCQTYSCISVNQISFSGTLTQWGACQTAGCIGTDNRPEDGWEQLWQALNTTTTDSRTAVTPPYSTDITWTYP